MYDQPKSPIKLVYSKPKRENVAPEEEEAPEEETAAMENHMVHELSQGYVRVYAASMAEVHRTCPESQQ